MGCLVFKYQGVERVKILEWEIFSKHVQLLAGNPFDEITDSLIVLSSDFPKIGQKYLNGVVISVLESCIKYLKVNKKLEAGTCFFTSSSNTPFLVFASIPKYIDGTLGEPDLLEKVLSEVYFNANERKLKSITFFVDCIYPKQLLAKSFFKFLQSFIRSSSCLEIKVFSNDTQFVIPT